SEYHIEKQIHQVDWYDDITDYIEFNIQSFGIPDFGKDQYLGMLKHVLNDSGWKKANGISDDKANELLIFIDENTNIFKKKKNREPTDLGALFETYEKWL